MIGKLNDHQYLIYLSENETDKLNGLSIPRNTSKVRFRFPCMDFCAAFE